ncbi:integrase [Allocatelliglobosispora scoriae]|uniref:Integrase n=1 Tax=Allocatelliglobosispora scoriae TaxID=643052 RepID=A0A841BTR1_9ACTN|nr:site-specific integrase [Allocatelliglobosispora scoriae]MBB5871085.1 integrase [Allocatelliglobosispora scoriae]
MAGKRRFGRVRKLPSGRFQARYLGPDSIDRPAPHTFPTKTDADRWLAAKETEIVRGDWTNPDAPRPNLGAYIVLWIDQRTLRPRTADLYRWLHKRYLAPTLDAIELPDLTPGMVRAWRAHLASSGVSASMIAKAYRLLRAVLNTATDDELIRRNPCRIKGAGQERPDERPVATIAQVFDIAGRIPARFRVLVLVAAFASLRYGELAALRRSDVDLEAGTVTVRATLVERSDGSLTFGPPKTNAGRRTVSLPAEIVAELRQHLADFVDDADDALVFTGATGVALRRSNFQTQARWTTSVARAGLPRFHFHDLRHTGNNLASETGATLRELMSRMGHESTRAAVIYQHATQRRDQAIAHGLNEQIHRARSGHAQGIASP